MIKKPSYEELEKKIHELEEKLRHSKATEERQDLNRKHLSEIYPKTTWWIWEIDLNGQYVFVGENVRQILGYEPESLIGMTPFDLMPETDRKMIRKHFETQAAEKAPIVNLENMNLARDGKQVCLLTNGVPIFDSQGRLKGYRGVDLDITGFRNKRAFIRRNSERRWQNIVNQAFVGIYQVTHTGKFLLVNPKLAQMVGYPSPEAFYQSVKNISELYFRSDDRTIILKELNEKRYVDGVEVLFQHRSGRKIWIRISARIVQDMPGEPVYEGFMVDITDQKTAELSFQKAEEKYRMLLENAGDAIVVVQDGKVAYQNPVCRSMLGQDESEIAHRPFFELVAEKDRSMLLEYHERRMRGDDAPSQYELDVIKGNNRQITVEVRASIIDYQGRPAAMAIIRDITERKHTEKELKKRLAFEKMLALISNLALSIEDVDGFIEKCMAIMGNTLDVSRIYIFEYRNETDTMDNTHEWVGPGIPAEVDNLQGIPAKSLSWWMDKMRHRRMIRYDDIEDLPSESVKNFLKAQHIKSILVVPLFIHNKFYGFMGFDECRRHRHWYSEDVEILRTIAHIISATLERLHDNKALKGANQALKESEQWFHSIFDGSRDAIFISSPDGLLVDVNRAAESLTGYCTNDLKGMAVTDLFAQEDRQLSIGFLTRVKRGAANSFEARILVNTGTPIRAELSCRRIVIGNVPFVHITARDISNRKRLERQLRQAQKMEAIGTLAGGIAHDFNNILGAIIGYAETAMIFEIPEDSPARSSIDGVLEGAYRARDLVQQILTFSRQTEQERKPVQIALVIREGLKFLRASLPTTIEIRPQLECRNETILADATQMHQVLMNLCTNSAHAMQQKGGVLAVSLDEVSIPEGTVGKTPELKPGAYARLTVSDTGCGMPPEILERIFDPYFTTKEKEEGTGLGLSVVHGIVKSHRGAVTVESTPGKGTVFRAFFPLLKTEPVETDPSLPLNVPTGNERILFVDDEDSLVAVADAILKRLGYHVVTKTASHEALILFKQQPDAFDMVITDMTMPRMTGIDLAKKLMEIRPGIPVIICTGFSEKLKKEDALDMGIRKIITKPFSVSGLAEAIRSELDRQKQKE